MGHWYAIRGVKACSSFRWIKQFTHLSVAKLLIESKNRGRVIPVLSTYLPTYLHVPTYLYLHVPIDLPTCTYLLNTGITPYLRNRSFLCQAA